MTTRQYRVLIVDDSPEDRATYRRLITRVSGEEEYVFTEVDTVAAALAECAHSAHSAHSAHCAQGGHSDFDCVLVDYLLPDGDGLNLLTGLTRPDEPLLVPVIVLTGQGDETVAVRAMKSGAQDYISKGRLTSESLHRAMHNAMEKVALLRKIEEQRAELTRLATLDELTGLHNRRFFLRRLQDEIERAMRYKSPLALLLLDVDHFKRVNDSYGHLVGDAVLASLAEVLRASFRRTDVAARYGGEEFCALLPQTDHAGAEQVAERLRQAFAAAPVALQDGTRLSVTCSAGVAAFGSDAGDAQGLLRVADARLYRAKAAGRNRVCSRD
jgi:two-component system cell cycle response regulator